MGMIFSVGVASPRITNFHIPEGRSVSDPGWDRNSSLSSLPHTHTHTHTHGHVLESSVCMHDQLCLTLPSQAPLSVGFPRQEHRIGCHALPGDLPDPGIEPKSLMAPALAGGFFTTSATWEAKVKGLKASFSCRLGAPRTTPSC